jgi:hypothetical protein
MAFGIIARTLLFVFASAILATPAQACRVARLPSERVASLYRHHHFGGAFLVRVIESENVQASPNFWRATARIVRVLRGPGRSGTISFSRPGGAGSCDPDTPAPTGGDWWVIYFTNGGQQNLQFSLAELLSDPRIRQRLRREGLVAEPRAQSQRRSIYERCAFAEASKYGVPPTLSWRQATAALSACRSLLRSAAVEVLEQSSATEALRNDEHHVRAWMARIYAGTASKLSREFPIT